MAPIASKSHLSKQSNVSHVLHYLQYICNVTNQMNTPELNYSFPTKSHQDYTLLFIPMRTDQTQQHNKF